MRIVIRIFLILLFCIFAYSEFYLLSLGYRKHDMHGSSLIMLSSGLLTGIVFLGMNLDSIPFKSLNRSKVSVMLSVLIAALGLYLYAVPWESLRMITEKYPVDFHKPNGSDIIPQVGILVERLLEGEFPYQPINKDDWDRTFTLFPTYLPLQWLPYTVAEGLNLDYRLYVFILFALLNLYLVVRSIKSNSSLFSTLTLGILPPLILIGLLSNDTTGGFRHSVELLIVTYYTLLAFTLVRFNWWAISILIAVCLLSRYSIVLWVPLFMLVLYRKLGLKVVFQSIGIMFLMFCIFYLPFLIVDPLIYFKGYDYHTGAAIGAWTIKGWQPDADTIPYSLKHGVGMGVFFYENIAGEIVDKLNACRYTHLAASMGSVLLLGVWYFKNEKRILPGVFLLGSLKIYLVVFYNFIQIPFIYLYWILPMISVVMLAVLFNNRKNAIKNNLE